MNFGKDMRLVFAANIDAKNNCNKKSFKVLNYFSHLCFDMPSLQQKIAYDHP
nr:MAG TPA: hypothetical protein [Caudoviricetes sp.]DAT34098.1 MAG TPA: hypothetical protein [Caudoviricetes sp.]